MAASTICFYRNLAGFFVLVLILGACNSPLRLGGKKSPHELYAEALRDAGLASTALGKAWLSTAARSLDQPTSISVPYRETGFFAADIPGAAGYSFAAKKGELISIVLETTPTSGFSVFMELWQQQNAEKKLLALMDTSSRRIEEVIDVEGVYIVRLQPELLQPVGYTLSISAGPSLAFPVRKEDNPRATSFWGAARDGGGRSHEGVDIFARKGTPAIASAGGRVTRVNENRLGGKVVFMRPDGKNYSLYYAHLDSQLVRAGQRVNPGDVIGLIGNTGNARTTPAHLHFGIYTTTGAADPWPFINLNYPTPPAVRSDPALVNRWARTSSQQLLTIGSQSGGATQLSIRPGTSLRILAASADQYKIQLPGGQEAFLKQNAVTVNPLKKEILKESRSLFSAPRTDAAVITQLKQGEAISILSSYDSYQLVEVSGNRGWLLQ